MIEFDATHRTFKISIPIPHVRDAGRYHQSLVRLLDRIEIDENAPALIEDLARVYDLMSHLLPDEELMNRYRDMTDGT